MATDVQDLILKTLDEIKDQQLRIIDRLDKVDDDFRKFENRVTKLETEAKNSRWLYAIVGGGIALAVKEGVVWAMRELLPKATDVAAEVFWYLVV